VAQFGQALRRAAGWFGLTKQGRQEARRKEALRPPPSVAAIAFWVVLTAVGLALLLTANPDSVQERVGLGLVVLNGLLMLSRLIRLRKARQRAHEGRTTELR
jgi:hypothetical protein